MHTHKKKPTAKTPAERFLHSIPRVFLAACVLVVLVQEATKLQVINMEFTLFQYPRCVLQKGVVPLCSTWNMWEGHQQSFLLLFWSQHMKWQNITVQYMILGYFCWKVESGMVSWNSSIRIQLLSPFHTVRTITFGESIRVFSGACPWSETILIF